MMKRLLVIAWVCLNFTCVQAQSQEKQQVQEDKLTRLMEEREQLVMEYQYYNQQNSNFWGKKSKNDLLSIIETLKKIINKDTELIAAVKEVKTGTAKSSLHVSNLSHLVVPGVVSTPCRR